MFGYLIVNFKYKLQSWEEITWNLKLLENFLFGKIDLNFSKKT